MGFFDGKEKNEEEQANTEAESNVKEFKPGKIGFAIWDVGGTAYRMKLRTGAIKELESRYKTSLMKLIDTGETMPPLSVMLDIIHAAMQDYNHGIKMKDVEALFDKYVDEGGSQTDFFVGPYMDVFTVSGFFSKSLTEDMQETLEKAKEKM